MYVIVGCESAMKGVRRDNTKTSVGWESIQ